MPIVKTLRRGLKYFYGVLLAVYLMVPAYAAFVPAQVPLLSSSAVKPNVMLQVDNSGSMDTIIFDAGYDPVPSRPRIYRVVYRCNFFIFCGYYQSDEVVPASNNSDYVFINTLTTTGCNDGYSFWRNSNTSVVCLPLADPQGGGRTRYPVSYLSYLVSQVLANNDVSRIPTQSRMTTAIDVAKKLVDVASKPSGNNTGLRMGLASYNVVRSGDSGPGGNIKQPIVDINAVQPRVYVPEVTAATADANYKALIRAIDTLSAEANTPLAETYYQVTRYFRGLTPSPAWDATSTLAKSPTVFTSPIQYRCQKNYGVVITDGLPTYDRTFPTDDPDDIIDTSRSLPNWDLVNNDGPLRDESDEGDSLYLDDIAKFAYDIDMRKDTDPVKVDLAQKSWDVGGFPKQNLSTYTIGFTVADQMLLSATDDTHGRGKYFQANDNAGLTVALNLALSDIYAKIGSGGGGAANSATLTSGTRFYQTLYDPSDWHGTIKAYDLDPITGALSGAKWTTDTLIVSGAKAPVFESWSTDTTPKKIELKYDLFSADQKKTLSAGLPTGVSGTDLVNWTKGIANAKLRPRTLLLGDIIYSPLIASIPSDKTSADLAGNTSYSTYLTTKSQSMSYSLLVNANDGFFNVLNADGTRRYAYMPSTALSSLATIATPGYGSGTHNFTVDGQIAVFDTQLGTSWRTVAFGGVGAGGTAYFAVKLFEGAADSTEALWEIKAPAAQDANNPYNNLGYAYSKPDVGRMTDGTSIVALGNGYGSYTGRASLLILNANTGAVIKEIQTPMVDSGETFNGLSSVKLAVNSQNIIQAAYAGDLKGRMWKFDLSGGVGDWKVAFGGKPLFNTLKGTAQPITVQPILLDHPSGNGKIVYFGTGKFSEVADKTSVDQQAFYAVWDSPTGVGGLAPNNLQQQSIIEPPISGKNATYYTSTSNDFEWNAKSGWFMALATATPYLGERIIYPAQTSRSRIIFTTAAVNSNDPCESVGTGRLFELDAAKGGMLTYQVLDTNGDNDVSSEDRIVSGMGIGTGIPNLASIVAGVTPNNDNKYLIDSSGGTALKIVEKGGTSNVFQRIMWRQIQ